MELPLETVGPRCVADRLLVAYQISDVGEQVGLIPPREMSSVSQQPKIRVEISVEDHPKRVDGSDLWIQIVVCLSGEMESIQDRHSFTEIGTLDVPIGIQFGIGSMIGLDDDDGRGCGV